MKNQKSCPALGMNVAFQSCNACGFYPRAALLVGPRLIAMGSPVVVHKPHIKAIRRLPTRATCQGFP